MPTCPQGTDPRAAAERLALETDLMGQKEIWIGHLSGCHPAVFPPLVRLIGTARSGRTACQQLPLEMRNGLEIVMQMS